MEASALGDPDRQSRHYQTLQALSREATGQYGDLPRAIRSLTEATARTLDVAQVGIWLFDDDAAVLRCVDQFDVRTDAHEDGFTVLRSDFPAYFAALDTSRAVDAHDAFIDPRTACLAEAYLTPNGVGALLDAPILVGGQLVGVVCADHVGGPRQWAPDEQLFAGSIADLASSALTHARQRATEDSLRRSREELSLALDAARMGTWAYDVAAERFRWSDEVGPLFGHARGWEPIDYRDYLALVHPDDHAAVRRAVRETLHRSAPFYVRHRVELPGGELRWIEVRGSRPDGPDGQRILGTVADVTAQQHLQDQLVHAQKMEGIGRLAGGIAHDFNNLLTAIGSCAELLGEQLADRPGALSLLGIIDRSAHRAGELTKRLLAFARQQTAEPRVVDLRAVVEDLQPILARVLREDITLVMELGDAQLPTHIDPTQLEQIVVNLVVNASDAMIGGGNLTVRADADALAEQDPRRPADAAAGPYVRLSVQDDGVGMDEHTQAHLFEPFFTTKPHGTGLGLATCYGIARQAGGYLAVQSTLGRGTTISVWLPRHAGPTDAAFPREARRRTAGSETLLLVEDDPRVRELSTEVLRGRGYRVLAAGTGEEALRLARRHPRRIDLLVSDVVMPDGGGCWLAEQLRSADPAVPVLLISGYGETPDSPTGGAAFLSKPFTTAALIDAVRIALDGRGPHT